MESAYRCLLDPHSGPVPMSAILAGAGLSSRAFYRHFVSKDDLFLALLQQACGGLVATVDRVADAAVGTPSEQLADWIGEMFDSIMDPSQLRQLAVIDCDEVRAAKGYREMRERLHVERERSLAEILRRGVADGSFPLADPESDAVAINAVLSRVVAHQNAEDVHALKQAQARVLDFARRAVGAVTSA
ncbi:TetR family transcriptional regulator [Mycobacterium sp. ITM-2017-0098]|nr:TetR family transcriptional regulator [Mycobacterium sp. ITM-2017-0098]